MKCYCKRTDQALTLCVDEVESEFENNLVAAWYKKTKSGYQKIFHLTDRDNGVSEKDIEVVCANFPKLGLSMFRGNLDWEKALSVIMNKFSENSIEWYIFGSVSDAIRGIEVIPHDIDIIVHTKDFFKVKDVFSDYVVEPFMDYRGTWIVRYFGRLAIYNSYIDIVASEHLNLENHPYDIANWKGDDVLIELFENRYQIELNRNRPERMKAMNKYRDNLHEDKVVDNKD